MYCAVATHGEWVWESEGNKAEPTPLKALDLFWAIVGARECSLKAHPVHVGHCRQCGLGTPLHTCAER